MIKQLKFNIIMYINEKEIGEIIESRPLKHKWLKNKLKNDGRKTIICIVWVQKILNSKRKSNLYDVNVAKSPHY